jgi:autotransporter-associated beta strand protein
MTLLTAGVSGGAAVNGLTVGTTYDVYFVAEDLKGNLQASPQLVSSAPVAAVDQFVTGGFSWGTSSVWSATTLGPYTDPWGGGNNAVFEGTGGVVAIASGTIVNDMTFNSNTWTLQGGPLTLTGTAQPVINVNTLIIPRLENALAGTQGFRKTGSGILRLVGTNSITGGIVIDGGWIGDNLGPAGTATLNNNDITANVGALGLIFGGGTVTNGGITLNDTTTPFSISNNNSSITVNGPVTGNGGIALPKTGNGSNTLNLNSTANTFTGVVNYTSDGIVSLNVNSFADATTLGTGDITFGLGNSANAHNFAYGSGATVALTLDKRQFTLAGAGATQTPTIKNNSSYAFTINTDLLSTTTGTRTLSLGGTGTGLSTFGGKITNGTIATLNLIKADSGTWVLGGDNDYNGTTTVSAGTLLINGDQSLATGAVAVNGGTLGGNGTIGGNVTVAAAGSVAPGASAGTLSIGGDLIIASLAAGKLVFELNTIAASDKIVLATGKVLTIGGGTLGLSDFSFTDLGGLENGTYTLIQTDQTISGSLAGDTNGTLGSATIDLQISGDGTDLELVVSGLAGGDPFATWATAAGLDGTLGKENGKADDPDGDGKNNLYEFAFNGDPLDGSDNGLMAALVQDASAPAGNELTLVVAVRDGATFTGSGDPLVQSNTTPVDGLTYTIEGTLDLATIPGSDVSHVGGPSDTAPVATGLPDLTGTDWEYHTFKLDASEGLGSKGFLRAKVE